MTTDEAITNLEGALAQKWSPWAPKQKTAIKLGIEALKQLQELRSTDLRWFDPLLPGETKD